MNDLNPISDIVIGGLDAVMPMEKNQKALLQKVDDIIQDAVEKNDPDIAGDALNYMLGVSRISGLTLAKTLYVLKFQWSKFKRRDSFEEYVEDYCGVKKTTRNRYVRVWELFVSGDVPKSALEKIKLHPIKSIVPISNLWYQKYDITDENWSKLANAPDVATINEICRTIKGKPSKSGSLQIFIESDGTLYAWQDNKRYFVGHLNVEDENEVVQKAIDRIKSDKILEKE